MDSNTELDFDTAVTMGFSGNGQDGTDPATFGQALDMLKRNVTDAMRTLQQRISALETFTQTQTPRQPQAVVEIPGEMFARYDMTTGEIVKWTWMPLGSFAGHLGPSAVVSEAIDGETGQSIEDDEVSGLNVEDTDGPFWKAVQADLARGGFNVDWEE